MALQPRQPLCGIVNFREAGIGVFLEGGEFLVLFENFFLANYKRNKNCYKSKENNRENKEIVSSIISTQ